MKLVEGLLITETEGEFIAIATGDAAIQFDGIIHLNADTAGLMKLLEEEQTEDNLILHLKRKYSLQEEKVRPDVRKFLGKLREKHLLVGYGEDCEE